MLPPTIRRKSRANGYENENDDDNGDAAVLYVTPPLIPRRWRMNVNQNSDHDGDESDDHDLLPRFIPLTIPRTWRPDANVNGDDGDHHDDDDVHDLRLRFAHTDLS